MHLEYVKQLIKDLILEKKLPANLVKDIGLSKKDLQDLKMRLTKDRKFYVSCLTYRDGSDIEIDLE